jgi:hypothetical protein
VSRKRLSADEVARLASVPAEEPSRPAPAPTATADHDGGPAWPGLLERARRYLAKMPPAVEGQHGSDATFEAAAVLTRDFGLADEEAWPLLCEWNQLCQPPWGEKDLRRKLEEGRRKGKGVVGSKRGRRPTSVPFVQREGGFVANREKAVSPGKTDENPTSVPFVHFVSEWEPPVPLGEVVIPPFPSHLLPEWARDFVEAVADSTQTPVDLAGVLALGVCGAGLARKYRIVARGDWSEPLNLYTVIALPPGNRKSAVFGAALEPVKEYEREERERLRATVAEAASARRVLEKRLAAAEAQAARESAERPMHEAEARRLARELAETPVLNEPRFLADDVTPEKLSGLLAAHGERMFVASAEGACFEIALGRYSEGNKANVEVYLKGHAGDFMSVDRTGRPSEEMDSPALSLALTVQPSVIASLGGSRHLSGRGFLARFLYAVPRSLVGRRQVGRPGVPPTVRAAYREGVRAVWQTQPDQGGDGRPRPRRLRLSSEADRSLLAFEAEVEPRLAEFADLGHIVDWGNKMVGAALRVAGILHVASGKTGFVVSADTLRAGIAVVRDYFLPHALAAFGLMNADDRTTRARLVLTWLGSHLGTICTKVTKGPEAALEGISRRDLHYGMRSRFATLDDLKPAVDVLIEHGYLQEVVRDKPTMGRPPSPFLAVNPLWLAEARKAATARPIRAVCTEVDTTEQNGTKPPESPPADDDDDSVGID